MESKPDSLELVQRARCKDTDSLSELCVRFQQPVLNRIRLMMGKGVRRVAESQDFFQEVMVEFLEDSAKAGLDSDRDILRWLTAIARNKIRDAARRRRARAFDSLSESIHLEQVPSPSPLPSSLFSRHEQAIRLAEALESLPPEFRKVIELHDLDGQSLRVVAEKLGRGYEAVKKLHTRAMLRLGGVLSRGGPATHS